MFISHHNIFGRRRKVSNVINETMSQSKRGRKQSKGEVRSVL